MTGYASKIFFSVLELKYMFFYNAICLCSALWLRYRSSANSRGIGRQNHRASFGRGFRRRRNRCSQRATKKVHRTTRCRESWRATISRTGQKTQRRKGVDLVYFDFLLLISLPFETLIDVYIAKGRHKYIHHIGKIKSAWNNIHRINAWNNKIKQWRPSRRQKNALPRRYC